MNLFAIFGNPVKHSISPKMHNLALQALNIQGCYIRHGFEDGTKVIENFYTLGLDGANVTVPHKEEAFKQADIVDDFAKEVGAVNTLVKKGDKVYGYNTDAPGFYKAIESFGKINSVLILGAGGTAKAIATILKEKNITVTVLNRSRERLSYFKEKKFQCYTWGDFKSSNYDLIVNTTSAGLSDERLPAPEDLLQQLFAQAKYTFDVIYNKQTPFLQLASKYNLQTKDGADMLLYQGVLAFNLFYNNTQDLKKIESAMKGAF